MLIDACHVAAQHSSSGWTGKESLAVVGEGGELIFGRLVLHALAEANRQPRPFAASALAANGGTLLPFPLAQAGDRSSEGLRGPCAEGRSAEPGEEELAFAERIASLALLCWVDWIGRSLIVTQPRPTPVSADGGGLPGVIDGGSAYGAVARMVGVDAIVASVGTQQADNLAGSMAVPDVARRNASAFSQDEAGIGMSAEQPDTRGPEDVPDFDLFAAGRVSPSARGTADPAAGALGPTAPGGRPSAVPDAGSVVGSAPAGEKANGGAGETAPRAASGQSASAEDHSTAARHPGETPSGTSNARNGESSSPGATWQSLASRWAEGLAKDGTRLILPRVLLRGDSAEFTTTLEPEALGRLGLRVEVRQGEVKISLAADQAASLRLIESSLPQLRAALEDQGLRLTSLGVNNGGPSFGSFGDGTAGQRHALGASPVGGEAAMETDDEVSTTGMRGRRADGRHIVDVLG